MGDTSGPHCARGNERGDCSARHRDNSFGFFTSARIVFAYKVRHLAAPAGSVVMSHAVLLRDNRNRVVDLVASRGSAHMNGNLGGGQGEDHFIA